MKRRVRRNQKPRLGPAQQCGCLTNIRFRASSWLPGGTLPTTQFSCTQGKCLTRCPLSASFALPRKSHQGNKAQSEGSYPGEGRVGEPTFPYLLKRFFRSVARVVDDNPLTHRFRLELLLVRPMGWEKHRHREQGASDHLMPLQPLGVAGRPFPGSVLSQESRFSHWALHRHPRTAMPCPGAGPGSGDQELSTQELGSPNS